VRDHRAIGDLIAHMSELIAFEEANKSYYNGRFRYTEWKMVKGVGP